jgi:prepilin-type N-terminal cleavage/methylation domain-containing protein
MKINMNKSDNGFTLVEMSVVLAIVALLLGGLLPTISSQMDQQNRRETRKQLEEIQQALTGFAIVNGRFPYPAKPSVASTDSVNNPGKEDNTIGTGIGVVPWATLGIKETDAWGRRFTYVVTHPAFDSTSTPITLTSSGTLTINNASVGGASLASAIPVVIISHGPNGYGAYLPTGAQIPTVGASADEIDNTNGTPFVSRENSTDFDDLVVWLSPNTIFERMVAAGRLP